MAFNDTSASEEKQSPRSSVRAWCTIGSISFVIALLASVAVWYLFLRGGNNDEEREAYICLVNFDEDEMASVYGGARRACPYYRFYDEYKMVQKQN